MESLTPRVVLAGTSSGCGKTTVTCAVLQALVNRNLRVGACKCGPDYIDPMFHSRIIGTKSRNLDLHFFSEETLRYLLVKQSLDRDISIVEGVMGYYDGMGLTTSRASTYHVARVTDSPVVLVVNAKGASVSILATIQGFLDFVPESNIRGILLNQCSAMSYGPLASAIEGRFPVKVLGYLPKLPECSLESRHLGLVTAEEVSDLKQKLSLLARQAEKTVNLDGLLALAREAPPIRYEPIVLPKLEPIRIGIARDEAFCFVYPDSLEVLTEMGAELVFFSPRKDKTLPENIQGLYFPGGYPELYGKELQENRTMRHAVYQALQKKLPCIAECGGFMYLTQAIGAFKMVGYLPGNCHNTEKLTRFGYVTLEAKEDNLLCNQAEQMPAHEFHYWDCDCPGDGFTAGKANGRKWACCVATDTLYAGYPHFHFCGNLNFARNFYRACIKEKYRYD